MAWIARATFRFLRTLQRESSDRPGLILVVQILADFVNFNLRVPELAANRVTRADGQIAPLPAGPETLLAEALQRSLLERSLRPSARILHFQGSDAGHWRPRRPRSHTAHFRATGPLDADARRARAACRSAALAGEYGHSSYLGPNTRYRVARRKARGLAVTVGPAVGLRRAGRVSSDRDLTTCERYTSGERRRVLLPRAKARS